MKTGTIFFGLESFFFFVVEHNCSVNCGRFPGIGRWVCIFGRVLDVNNGYQFITLFSLLIAIAAGLVLSKGHFDNPVQKRFIYTRFHLLWQKLLTLAGLKGMVQGFLVTAPAILVMRLVGNEGGSLGGLIQGVGGLLTAILIYILGRIAKPKHRMAIFGLGLFVFFL